MAVAADAVGLVAHDEGGLGVHLQADEAVDDVDARRLQRLGPLDVGALVEASLELDQHRHLLAALGGADQRAHDRAVARGAVERHLDGEHVRVDRRLADELLDGGAERVVGVVHEHVAVAEHVEEVGPLLLAVVEPGRRHPLEHRVLELRAVERVDRPQAAEVERPLVAVGVVLAEVELAQEELAHLVGDVVR